MRSWIILFALILSFSHEVSAQTSEDEEVAGETYTNEVDAKALGGALRFDRIQDGLSPGRVDAIQQDSVGFMWIGTEGGLARYDGHDFTVYGEENAAETGFTGTNVTALASDASGTLWIGTAEAGLFSYNTEHDAFKSVETPLGNSISSLFADATGRLWVAYATGGASLLKDGEWTNEKTEMVFVSMRAGKDGYWLATRNSGLIKLSDFDGEPVLYSTVQPTDFGDDPESEKRYLSSDNLTDIVVDKDGTVWVATADAGLNHLNPATGEISHYYAEDAANSLISDTLSVLAIDKRGNLWVASLQGLSMYNRETDHFQQFRQDSTNPTSLGGDWVTSIAVDAGGVVWLGHMINGVSKTHPSRLAVELYRTEAKTPLSMAVDGEGILWVGVINSGLWALDRKGNQVQIVRSLHNDDYDLRFTENVISSIQVTGDSLWLTSATAGLIHFRPGTGEFEVFDSENSELPSERLWSSALDGQGNLWLGSEADGLIRFNPKSHRVESWATGEIAGLASNQVMVVHMDEDAQHLWVGTPNGLLRLDTKTMETQGYTMVEGDASSLPSSRINAVWQKGDSLWVATDAGIGELSISSGKVRRFSREQGLSNDMVYGVVEAEGQVWISTNGGGLQRLDPATATFETYREQDGFQGNEYAMNSYYKTPTGELIFGGTKGFNIFSPKSVERPDNLGPLVLTGVDVANKPYKFAGSSWNSKSASMDHSSGIIKFRFSSLGYAAPDIIRYQYRLKPLFKEWTEVGSDQRFATYTNLSGGDYTFEVKAQSASGEWTEPIKMNLDVAPPFYLAWWAFVIEAIILGLIIFSYVKYQRQKLNAALQESHLQKVEKDLELTGAVQAGFLPNDVGVSTDKFDILGFYRPAESCSGDWWWFEQEADGRYAILVGDVTGHGPGPAMVTAAVATAYRVQSLAGGDIEERLHVINSEVLRVSRGKYQMTLTAIVVDIVSGEYTIYSAGGLPVMSQDQPGAKVRSLPCRGTPLGTEDVLIGTKTGTLSPGARVILYTDGIPETDMANGKQLGMRRFAKLFGDTMEMALPLASRHLVDVGDMHREERPQDDDWTFVIAQWRGPGELSVEQRG